MMKQRILCLALLALSLGLAVLGYFILPENVVIQFSIGSSGNSSAPKLLALLIPTVLGVGGAVTALVFQEDGKRFAKCLLVCAIGIGVGIFMLVVNTIL